MNSTLTEFFKTGICCILPLAFFINCSEPENIDIHLSLSEFEDQLLTHEGNNTSTSELDGKYLGIYFSSYYCPPCRDFTPKLVEFREKHADEFEVVFVSSDFEEDDQFNYIKEANMKFLTLPIDSNVSFHLSEKLGVEGIPSVAIVSPTGKVLTLKGTDHISDNSENALSDWKSLSQK